MTDKYMEINTGNLLNKIMLYHSVYCVVTVVIVRAYTNEAQIQ